jgi:hypothetical protein
MKKTKHNYKLRDYLFECDEIMPATFNYSFLPIDSSSLEMELSETQLNKNYSQMVHNLKKLNNQGMVIVDNPSQTIYVVTNEETPAKLKFTSSYFAKLLIKENLSSDFKTKPVTSEEMLQIINIKPKKDVGIKPYDGTKKVLPVIESQVKMKGKETPEAMDLGKVRKGDKLIFAISGRTLYTPTKISSSVFGKKKVQTVFSKNEALEDGIYSEKGKVEITVEKGKVSLVRIIRGKKA